MKQYLVTIRLEENVMAPDEEQAATVALDNVNRAIKNGYMFTIDNVRSVGEVTHEEDIEISTEPEEEEE